MDPENTGAAADDSVEDAFVAGFNSPSAEEAPAATQEQTETPGTDGAPAAADPAKPDAVKGEGKGDEGATKDDATLIASLPEHIRKKIELADDVPKLRHDLNSARGRIAAYTRKQNAAAAPPPAAPKREARDKIKADLPEVVSAIDEAVDEIRSTAAAQAAESSKATAAAQEELLDETYPPLEDDPDTPEWMRILNSSDFDAYLKTLPPEQAKLVRTTDRAAPILRAIDGFKKAQKAAADAAAADQAANAERAAEAERQKQRQRDRIASATQPRGSARAPADPSTRSAFEDGFYSAAP